MPKLYLICGPAGVGKSTYGKKLAAELGACLLDSDTVSEPVVRAGLEFAGLDPRDRDSPIYKATYREAVYQCLYDTALENLAQIDVIIVGPFTREIRSESWLQELEERFAVPVEVLFVTCASHERRRRIEARGNPRDLAKLNDWQAYLADSGEDPPAFPYQKVDTT